MVLAADGQKRRFEELVGNCLLSLTLALIVGNVAFRSLPNYYSLVRKVRFGSLFNYYSLFTTGNLLLTARCADLGNCLMCLMAVSMVEETAFFSISNYYSLTYC